MYRVRVENGRSLALNNAYNPYNYNEVDMLVMSTYKNVLQSVIDMSENSGWSCGSALTPWFDIHHKLTLMLFVGV
jgi:hypothetical protein